MNKLIFTLLFGLASLALRAQFFMDAAPVLSLPMPNPFAEGDYRSKVYTGTARDFFPSISAQGWGGSLGFRYRNGSTAVGLQVAYVGFQDRTALVHTTMFSSVIQGEYYFRPPSARWHPYLGLNLGIFQPKYIFDPNEISSIPLAQSFLGLGFRGGITWEWRGGHTLYAETAYQLLSLATLNVRVGYLLPLGFE